MAAVLPLPDRKKRIERFTLRFTCAYGEPKEPKERNQRLR